jgi:Zn-dependent M16 (insulinase) family peptidase
LHRGIISTAKLAMQPLRHGDATAAALGRYLAGETREVRNNRYRQLLAATPDEVKRALLNVLEQNLPAAPVCVLSSREKLETANRERPDAPLEITEIVNAGTPN